MDANIEAAWALLDNLKNEALVFTKAQVITKPKELWHGIAFRIAGRQYVANLKQVAEVVAAPVMISVPKVNTWLPGMIRFREMLVPAIIIEDLGDNNLENNFKKSALIVCYDNEPYGILVDKILGLKKFYQEKFYKGETVNDFVIGEFVKKEQSWRVLDLMEFIKNVKQKQILERN